MLNSCLVSSGIAWDLKVVVLNSWQEAVVLNSWLTTEVGPYLVMNKPFPVYAILAPKEATHVHHSRRNVINKEMKTYISHNEQELTFTERRNWQSRILSDVKSILDSFPTAY